MKHIIILIMFFLMILLACQVQKFPQSPGSPKEVHNLTVRTEEVVRTTHENSAQTVQEEAVQTIKEKPIQTQVLCNHNNICEGYEATECSDCTKQVCGPLLVSNSRVCCNGIPLQTISGINADSLCTETACQTTCQNTFSAQADISIETASRYVPINVQFSMDVTIKNKAATAINKNIIFGFGESLDFEISDSDNNPLSSKQIDIMPGAEEKISLNLVPKKLGFIELPILIGSEGYHFLFYSFNPSKSVNCGNNRWNQDISQSGMCINGKYLFLPDSSSLGCVSNSDCSASTGKSGDPFLCGEHICQEAYSKRLVIKDLVPSKGIVNVLIVGINADYDSTAIRSLSSYVNDWTKTESLRFTNKDLLTFNFEYIGRYDIPDITDLKMLSLKQFVIDTLKARGKSYDYKKSIIFLYTPTTANFGGSEGSCTGGGHVVRCPTLNNNVVVHELFHNFGAIDDYHRPNFCKLEISGLQSIFCINNGPLEPNNAVLIGWGDLNNNGIIDVVETT